MQSKSDKMKKPGKMVYIIYSVTKNGITEVFMTNKPIGMLREYLGISDNDTLTINFQTQNFGKAVKTFDAVKLETTLTPKEMKVRAARKEHCRSLGKKHGGQWMEGTAHKEILVKNLEKMRKTYYLCPDGHVSNEVFYKYWCFNHNLDVTKAHKISREEGDRIRKEQLDEINARREFKKKLKEARLNGAD